MKTLILSSLLGASIILASDIPSSYNSCIGCHGIKGGNKALGKSKIIKEMSKEDIVTALNGYKDGSYGGAMKGVMKGQVMKLTENDINDISEYISNQSN